jgi:DNA-binding NarL/FixJ family response regulator
MIYISIIEKDPEFRKILSDFFQGIGGYTIVEVYAHTDELLHSYDKPKHLDIIILSMNNGEEDPAVVKPLKILHANARIIIAMVLPEISLILEFLKNRADGIILKSGGLYEFHTAATSSLRKGLVLSPILTRLLVDALFFQGIEPPLFDFTQR